MKMKRLFCLTSLLTIGLLLNSFAQDNTKVGLPEGAIARLGKGGINLMRFSPDGTRLVVGTDVGVWLYNVPEGKETALFATANTGDGKIHLWDATIGSRQAQDRLGKSTHSLSQQMEKPSQAVGLSTLSSKFGM